VEEFLEREERKRKLQEEASKPKKLRREEWMLVPPTSGDLLASLDPTKARPCQFARSAASVVAVFVCIRIMCVGAGVPRLLTIRNTSFTTPRCNPDITEQGDGRSIAYYCDAVHYPQFHLSCFASLQKLLSLAATSSCRTWLYLCNPSPNFGGYIISIIEASICAHHGSENVKSKQWPTKFLEKS